MKKSSAKCISCISYTRTGNDSGKLPGMTELAEIRMRAWHAFAGSPADKLAKRWMKKLPIVPNWNKAI
jgi:hypothetical protein